MTRFLKNISPNIVFTVFSILTLSTVLVASATQNYALLLVPVFLLAAMFVVQSFKATYLLLLCCLPLSIEFEVGGGYATDLPTEPLMILLLFLGVLYAMANPKVFDRRFFSHTITRLLLLHLFWIAIAALYSQMFFVSFKFLLAKTWYVVSFTYITSLFVKKEADYKTPFWCILIPLIFTVCYTIYNHAMKDFGFHEANRAMQPFFRNHVNYAVMLVVFFPFMIYALRWYKKGSLVSLFLKMSIAVIIVGIALAMTRAAYVALLLMPIAYWMIKKKWTKGIVFISLVLLFVGIGYYTANNRWLDLAPDYETTIYHNSFNDHLSATFAGKDVSFMERIYRWVAAVRMIPDNLYTGFGPGNFYNFYQTYTLSTFETYVSDNPEKSGVHNYFLMVLVEQGLIGLIIFFMLIIGIFIKGEQIYHQQKGKNNKAFVMTVLLSLLAIALNILMADLIEVDKIGSLFFMNIAILINCDLLAQKQAQEAK